MTDHQPQAESSADNSVPNRQRGARSRKRQLFCPAHPEQKIEGNGKKYFIHLVSAEELKARGMNHKKAKLVIEAYPVLVMSNEWLEELFCPQCGTNRWCYVTKIDKVRHSTSLAPRELWEQVAHVDPIVTNPSVSQFTRRSARRTDTRRLFDPC